MSVFGWIIILQRAVTSGAGWHYMSWDEYKAGFGSIDTADLKFWLGLEKMHLLTSSQPYRL